MPRGSVWQSFAVEIATSFPDRVLLGTSIRGNFTTAPSAAFGCQSYSQQCTILHSFLDEVTEAVRGAEGAEAAKMVRDQLRYLNAALVYNLVTDDQIATRTTGAAVVDASVGGASPKSITDALEELPPAPTPATTRHTINTHASEYMKPHSVRVSGKRTRPRRLFAWRYLTA